MQNKSANGLLIKRINDRLERDANNSLRKDGLTMMQVAVLLTLQSTEKGQLTLKEIEQHFGVAQPTAAGIVSRLEQKQLVEALGDAADKRIKIVRITPMGQACCARAEKTMHQTEQKILQGFTDNEKEQLNRLLHKIVENLA